MSGGEYELIYEGPADDSADTLRRIKKTLVGELSFSIEETKEFLEKTPATLFTADDEHSLDEYYHILKKAGARVYVVRPRGKKTQEVEFEVSLDFEEEKKKTKVFDVSEDLSIDDNLPTYEPQEEEHEAPKDNSKAFVISDDHTSLEHLMSNLSTEDEENEYVLTTPETKEETIKIESEEKDIVEKKTSELNFSFDSSEAKSAVEVKTEKIPPLAAKDETPNNTESTENNSLDFSFDSKSEPKKEEKPKNSSPPPIANKTSSFDLTFEVEEPKQVVEAKAQTESAGTPEEKKENWDLSIDIPKQAQQQATIVEEPKEVSKAKSADDILNDFDPNEEAEKNKREEVIIPPLAEALSHKKPSVTQENPSQPQAQVSKKEVESKQGSRDIFFIALVGTIILWIGNHWYFSNQEQFKSEVDKSLDAIPKPSKKEKSLIDIPPDKVTLVGTEKNESGEIEATVVEQQGKILQISISFKGVETAPLSPEQIVNGYKKKPWIEQIRFDPAGLETDIDGGVKVSGPARISVNDDSEVKRLIGTGELSAKLSNNSLNLKFSSQYGTKQQNQGVLVKRSENGLITSVLIETTIALSPKSS